MGSSSKIYSYIVAHDSGFAPNPFNGFCTLATCKPDIRRLASLGDWIVGTGSSRKRVHLGGVLVYAMRVHETLCFAQYWNDSRFERKKPNLYGSYRAACGDNIYYPLGNGKWRQIDSFHSKRDGSPHQDHIKRDTRINRVLIGKDFVYFGANGYKIPISLEKIVPPPGHRKHKKFKDQDIIIKFEDWLKSLHAKGYQGKPFNMIKRMRKRGATNG